MQRQAVRLLLLTSVLIFGTASAMAADVARAPATAKPVDPNAAVEIRGQARTLSMMLVLKNGKDGINFIKVRKDFRPEISRTEY